MKSEYSKLKTGCFWGSDAWLSEKRLNLKDDEYCELEENIKTAVDCAVGDGLHAFICVMNNKFSVFCADVILEMRGSLDRWYDLRIIAVEMTEGDAADWSTYWRGKRSDVIDLVADEVIVLHQEQPHLSANEKIRDIIDHCSRLICFYHDDESDAACAVREALIQDVPIANLSKVGLASAVAKLIDDL